MKQTIYLFLLLMISTVHVAYGDEIKSIRLDNKNHSKEIVSLPFCNIFVELQQGDQDNQYGISIKMENISEDKVLYLFDKSYDEKTLKKEGLVYDKVFQGAKGKRVTEACDRMPAPSRRLKPSETENILSFQSHENIIKCRLPIYIARYDEKNYIVVKKKKISLAQKEVIELEINVEKKSDEDLIRLSASTDSLIDEIGKQTFCSNKNHRGTPLKTLYSKYNKSIDILKEQVLQRTRGYMSTDKEYSEFMAIYNRLDSINLKQLTVTSCRNDKRIKGNYGHNCKFCSLSADEIYKRLEAFYIELHNGKATKGQIMSNVEALYNCAQKNTKRNTGNYMSRISMYYNKIKSK